MTRLHHRLTPGETLLCICEEQIRLGVQQTKALVRPVVDWQGHSHAVDAAKIADFRDMLRNVRRELRVSASLRTDFWREDADLCPGMILRVQNTPASWPQRAVITGHSIDRRWQYFKLILSWRELVELERALIELRRAARKRVKDAAC